MNPDEYRGFLYLNMNHNQTIGSFGEKLAKNYLINQGYTIIAANLRLGKKELDLVATKDGLTIFVEVKTMSSSRPGGAEDQIDHFKIRTLKKAVMDYCREFRVDLNLVRADLLAIDLVNGEAKIKHFKDIF